MIGTKEEEEEEDVFPRYVCPGALVMHDVPVVIRRRIDVDNNIRVLESLILEDRIFLFFPLWISR